MSLLIDIGREASFTKTEVIAICSVLVVGGHETTLNLIGHGLLGLFEPA